jgi:hypothetical protein
MGLRTLTRQTAGKYRETTAAIALDLNRDDDMTYLQSVLSDSRSSSRESWKWFEKLGTIHKAVSRSARIAGYARFRAVRVNEDGTDGDQITDGLPADIVSGIYSPWGGTRGLIDRFYALMKVSGDSYLIRIRDEDGVDGYHMLSSDEFDGDGTDLSMVSTENGPLRWNTLPSSGGGVTSLIQRECEIRDMLGRVWLPGRRFIDQADSPLAALSTECEILHTLTLALKGRIRSRFALAGMMYIPSEIQNVVVAGLKGRKSMDILDYLSQAMRANVADYENASVTLPIMLRGPGQHAEQLRWISMDRDLLEADLKLREQLIDEILFGLDINQGATKGSESANHWGAWAMSDEEIRIAVQPDLDILTWAMTRLILHPQLEDDGMAPDQIMKVRVAWDISESAVRTNRQEDTRQAHELGLAAGKSVMRVTGLTDDDLMLPQEQIRQVGRQMKNPYLALFTGTDESDIDWDEVERFGTGGKPGPGAETATEDSSTGPGVGDPGSPGGGDADKDEKPE